MQQVAAAWSSGAVLIMLVMLVMLVLVVLQLQLQLTQLLRPCIERLSAERDHPPCIGATCVEEKSASARSRVLASAFRGGFVAVYTSFTWLVEHGHSQMQSGGGEAPWSLATCATFVVPKAQRP